MFWSSSQPMEFSHKKHSAVNMNCQACHPYARESDIAGVIGARQCFLCHERDTNTKASSIKEYIQRREEIRWVKVYNVPENVVFSHKQHLLSGEMNCDICHGEIGQMEKPITEPIQSTVTMDGCIACHQDKGASTDCLSCHK